MKIIVFGGSGFIGRQVCEHLVRAGHSLTVPTRRLDHARSVQMLPGVQPVLCDVRDNAQLAQQVAGHDVLINLIAVLQGSEARFDEVHVQLPQRLAAACARTGVRHVVHVSALGVAQDAPSRYLRSKARGDAAWQRAAQEQGLSVSLVRPSVVFGAQDRFTNLFARLLSLFPIMPLAGADSLFQPVWVDDVARAIAALVQPGQAGQVHLVEAAGPQRLSLREIVRTCGQITGCERPILALPGPLATVQALSLELLPGEPLMSRDNLASMRVPNVASGQHADLSSLGIEPASLAAVAPTYLRLHSAFDTYRQHARR